MGKGWSRNYTAKGEEYLNWGKIKLRGLTSTDFPLMLRIVGWAYLIISVVGGIYLIANSKISGSSYNEFIPASTNYVYIALGISGIITGLVGCLIFIALARMFEQNILILQYSKKKK